MMGKTKKLQAREARRPTMATAHAQKRPQSLALASPTATEPETAVSALMSSLGILSSLATAPRRILVLSLGNPGAVYADTLHSAGHMALTALQHHLRCVQQTEQPPFTAARHGKKSTPASEGPKYTLLQCPTAMNVSGPWAAKALKEQLDMHRRQLQQLKCSNADAFFGLVVVHDDLEEDLGVVKIRRWERSHRGHNGVRSVNASIIPTALPCTPCLDAGRTQKKWARVSVGIGRPVGRDATTVSDFVLRPMSRLQKGVLRAKAGPGVLAALTELEEQWWARKQDGN